MYVIYDAEKNLWLSCISCGNTWTENVEQALTWETEEEAKAAAAGAGICSCWVTIK